ncbi:MAG: response regulator [Deltaproteobacteria bacterium]|nr:response regulator [Deltaproteobacteria bacterium]
MSKRILLIDSDESFAQGLQAAFAARGLSATTATNSENGMSLAKAEPPDLIVVCVEAQPTNGYMLCTRLKKDDALKGIPVVLTSANATPDSFEKHKKLKTRAEEYLIKPFPPQTLLEKAAGLLGIQLAEPAAEEEIVSVDEDEPLGLGDLVTGDDEPVHLSDAEAAEAQGLQAQPVEESVVVDEVQEVEQVQESAAHGDDDELKMFDAAFDSLAPTPAPKPEPVAAESDEQAFAHLRLAPPPDDLPASAETTLEEAPAEPEAMPEMHEVPAEEPAAPVAASATAPIIQGVDPAVHAELEAKANAHTETIARLESELAPRTAEPEAAKKGGGTSADLIKLKGERTRQDKEILKLKEEANAKDKELIELREQQNELELTASTLKDESIKREAAAKSLQQRADALAAAAKKFERELGTAREELKAVPGLKARVAELEAVDKAHTELKARHADLSSEAEQHKARAGELETEIDRHKTRAGELETELSGARALHEGEVEQLKEELETFKADMDKLEQQLAASKGETAKAQGEVEQLRAQLEQVQGDVTALTGEKDLISEERDELRGKLEEATAAAAQNEERAIKAYQRIKSDEKLREKTKKALQIALQLLDEVPAGLEGELGEAVEKQSA